MNHSSIARVLFVSGALAFATGLAQAADTFNSPQIAGEASTMTNGAPNLITENSPPVYTYSYSYIVPGTTVMGAGPVVVYSYPYYSYYTPRFPLHEGASETSNVPQRAGEVSTMTNGAPNLMTQN